MATLDNSQITPEILQRVQNSEIFTHIWANAAKKGYTNKETISAQKWFKKKALELGSTVKPEDLMFKQNQLRKQGIFGQMFHFFYIPKHKDNRSVLPYYDIFPLIFMVQPAQEGFYGINLHYLAPNLRAKLMDKLWNIRNNSRFDDTTKLKLSYDVLSGSQRYAEFKPCFKHYLHDFVYSKFLWVESTDWVPALFLPTERFVRSSKQGVWKESAKLIREAKKNL